MEASPRVAIVGTGNVGGNLGVRLASVGVTVVFGQRPGNDLTALLERAPSASAAPLLDAVAGADVVILAVPGGVAVEAAKNLGDLSGKIVVDCTNPLRFEKGPVWQPPAEGSNTAALAAALPGATWVKAFNTFGAEFHADPALSAGPVDVQMASDDADAKGVLTSLIETAGFNPVDAGPLRNAAVLENLAVLWIHLALVGGRGRHAAFKMVDR